MEQDRAGSEKFRAAYHWAVAINDRRNLAVRVQGQELGRLLLVHVEVDDTTNRLLQRARQRVIGPVRRIAHCDPATQRLGDLDSMMT